MGFPEAVKKLRDSLPKKPELKKSVRKKTIPSNSPPPPRREPSRRLRKLDISGCPLGGSLDSNCVKSESFEIEKPVDRRLHGTLKIEDEASVKVFSDLTGGVCQYDSKLDLSSCSISEYGDQLSSLKFLKNKQIGEGRTQSMLVHPSTLKPVIVCGDKYGNVVVWDVRETNGKGCEPHRPHRQPVNCLSVSKVDDFKLYSTSHDGTVVEFDFNKGKFTNIFATDFDERVTHLTWHDELGDETLLVAHGNGDVGVLDTRAGKKMQQWVDCFQRSARTVQHHPSQSHYILVSSGTGSFKIFDMREAKEPVSVVEHPKTLTSAFFSYRGSSIVSTCGDDRLRVYDSTTICNKLPMKASYPHNNFTGRWLSVFKATWVPRRDDLFHIGSLLKPRRIQFYTAGGEGILNNVADDSMTTICSVVSLHPSLPVVAGANSVGRVYLFGPPDFLD